MHATVAKETTSNMQCHCKSNIRQMCWFIKMQHTLFWWNAGIVKSLPWKAKWMAEDGLCQKEWTESIALATSHSTLCEAQVKPNTGAYSSESPFKKREGGVCDHRGVCNCHRPLPLATLWHHLIWSPQWPNRLVGSRGCTVLENSPVQATPTNACRVWATNSAKQSHQ